MNVRVKTKKKAPEDACPITGLPWGRPARERAAVQPLLDGAFLRLQRLCATLLHRDYPRLTHPPLNLQTDELLSAVVERLLKALREARPRTVREFFALAGQHMRWELKDLARRLDKQPTAVELCEGQLPAPASSDSGLSPDGRRMLEAIDSLPEDEREAWVRTRGADLRLLAAGLAQDAPGRVAPGPRSPSRSVRSWRPRSSRRCTVLEATPSNSAAST